jgi:hypothetical protein
MINNPFGLCIRVFVIVLIYKLKIMNLWDCPEGGTLLGEGNFYSQERLG